MFSGGAKFQTSKDNLAQVTKSLKNIENLDVLVGIPQEKDSREKENIGNAELAFIHTHGVRSISMRLDMEKDMANGNQYTKAYEMYIHSHGSPIWNSPPRPIIEPAIEDDKEVIAGILAEAARLALSGDEAGARKELEKAGLEGQGAAQEWFTNPKNNWAPNSEETIKEKGSDRPLIDTGQLRKSITYVVREK